MPEAADGSKAAARREILARRRAVGEGEARAVGDRITEHLLAADGFRRAQRIALYAATDGEPDLRGLFDAVRTSARTALLPRCEPGGSLSFRVVEAWSDLVTGRFGLSEPDAGAERYEVSDIDWMLIPAVAIDRSGGRLGRGGGWYDRTLAGPSTDRPSRIAVVHAFQLIDRVPRAEHDRGVDGYVCEDGLSWVDART